MKAQPSTLFYYRVAMPDGSVTEGELAATSQVEALLTLQRRGARPIRLQSSPIRRSWLHREVAWFGSSSLSEDLCAQFCRELHILTAAGLELSSAIENMMASEQKGSKLLSFEAIVLRGINLGKSMSVAIAESGFRLPTDIIPVIRAGEVSGNLAAALGSLGDTLTQRSKLASQIVSAMAYPIFLLLVVMLVLAILAGFVAPSLGRLFESLGRPAPMIIDLLWHAPDAIAQNALALSVCVMAALLTAALLVKTTVGQSLARGAIRALPIIGGIVSWNATARFASVLKLSLATNVATGLALERALLAAGVLSAHEQRRSINLVRQGSSIEFALKGLHFLPAKAAHLVGVGERTGRLDQMLAIVVDEARAQTSRRAELIGNLLGPVLIVFVGLIVGLTVFSIFTALMEVNNIAS